MASNVGRDVVPYLTVASLMLLFLGMKALPKKLLPLTLIGIAVTSLFSVGPAQAYTVTLEQVGSTLWRTEADLLT